MSQQPRKPAQKTGPEPYDLALVREIAESMKVLDGPLIPILHALNERFGYVDDTAIPVVADVLNLTRAEVHGVVSFYHDFRHEPAKRHVLKICRAEACQSMGAEKLFADVAAALGDSAHVTLEPVYCLGNCALSPSAMIDGKLLGRVDTARALAEVGK
ncbi:MAG: formate dehydrogenase subunit gamma [Rhodospirillales bacterium]|nr:formate dehydrogenase subunit gamma [Rhodospirillales bacterium]